MNKTNLSAYMAMTVSQLKEEQRMGTAHVYQSTLNRIKDFMEQNSISFEEVTPGQCKNLRGKFINCYPCLQIHSLWN